MEKVGKEPCKVQMKIGMLHPSNVQVHWHVLHCVLREGFSIILAIQIPEEVPAAVKVSMVSVSLLACPPHIGQVVASQSSHCNRGEGPLLASWSPDMGGSVTCSWSAGTGTVPQAEQWTTGMGVPQYLCLEINQSFRLELVW